MADLVAIRDALAARLSLIDGLRASATLTDAIVPPAAQVGDVELDFDQAFGRSLDEVRVRVRLYASRADEQVGQRRLDGYLAGSGDSSVKEVLEAGRSLSGAAETLQVTSVRGYGVYLVGGVNYLGAEFLVTVWAKGQP